MMVKLDVPSFSILRMMIQSDDRVGNHGSLAFVSNSQAMIVRHPIRTQYLTSTEQPGLARPWMLAWRVDFGTSGMVEPEVFEQLVQLVCSEGFLSDPNHIATEKVSCREICHAWLEAPYEPLPELREHLVVPFSLAFLKGWKRCLALLFSLGAIRELGLEGQIVNHLKAVSALGRECSVCKCFC